LEQIRASGAHRRRLRGRPVDRRAISRPRRPRPGLEAAAPGFVLPSYHGNIESMETVTRTQTGVRLESRMLKVLKALATELDLSLGDLLEGVVLHAFEGKAP